MPPKSRDIAMVFQSYALYPHMTVAENMGFALKLRGIPKAKIKEKVAGRAAMLDLGKYLNRKPRALSGGQRQRVAMGRAIVREPSVFLMDEPLSNLDAKLRVETRANIAALQQRLRTTTIYVTHDQVEAMTMGHRVAVLRDGLLQQCDTPRALYDRPGERVRGWIHRLTRDEHQDCVPRFRRCPARWGRGAADQGGDGQCGRQRSLRDHLRDPRRSRCGLPVRTSPAST